MTLATPPSDPDAEKIDEAIARIDKAIIVIRERVKSGRQIRPSGNRITGERRSAARAYLQGAAAESLYPPPTTNGRRPPVEGDDPKPKGLT